MTISIRPDAGGFDRLPDAIGFLNRYIEKGNKAGRKNAVLEVQQHSGYEWAFEIWHTKTGYFISIRTKPFEYLTQEDSNYVTTT